MLARFKVKENFLETLVLKELTSAYVGSKGTTLPVAMYARHVPNITEFLPEPASHVALQATSLKANYVKKKHLCPGTNEPGHTSWYMPTTEYVLIISSDISLCSVVCL